MRAKKIIYNDDQRELARETVEAFFRKMKKILSERSRVVVSIPGGNSVRPFFKLIARRAEALSKKEWEKVHFFWTDERLVPPDHEESNYRLAAELFLNELREEGLLPQENVHRFHSERSNPEKEIARYSRKLKGLSGGIIHIPILGVGEDGHVGSLFPHRPELRTRERDFFLIEESPKPPAKRITISPQHIIDSTYPFLFFIGERKKKPYENFLTEEANYLEFPCKLALTGEKTAICYVITDIRETDQT